MKAHYFFIVFCLAAISSGCVNSAGKNQPSLNADKGFAVVELFTSEGCSSCPPADNAVAKLLKAHSSNVYVLGYHVDYWDNLGWKDIFSAPAYTQLQRTYAKAFKLSSVYTPQVVVNGTEQFVGSDEKKLNEAVNKSLQQAATSTLNIEADLAEGNKVRVHYSTDASHANLHIALIQLAADNKIARGENRGATLHHINVVRDANTVAVAGSGNIMMQIPESLRANDCRIIAFTQDITNSKITAATEALIK